MALMEIKKAVIQNIPSQKLSCSNILSRFGDYPNQLVAQYIGTAVLFGLPENCPPAYGPTVGKILVCNMLVYLYFVKYILESKCVESSVTELKLNCKLPNKR